MYYKLSASQENELLNQPETGMGYQVIEATKAGSYISTRFIVLNTEIAIPMDGSQASDIKEIIYLGIERAKAKAFSIVLYHNSIRVFSEKQFRNILNEPGGYKEKGATDNPPENANGDEIFVRLSAFDDDKRIDKTNNCLRPGSYTTTMEDYFTCKVTHADPINRYALPSNDEIRFAFHIKPVKTDTLQRGTVQPANGKSGGGKEVYFENGTSKGTFLKQTPY